MYFVDYPVAGFGGTKSLILSNTSFTGGKNLFLGYAYIVVGCSCFVLGLLFLIIHIKYKPRYLKVIVLILKLHTNLRHSMRIN